MLSGKRLGRTRAIPFRCARRSRWPLYAVSPILASAALGRLAAWSPATTGRTGDCRTAGNAGRQHCKQHLTNEERQPLRVIVVNHCKQLLVGLQSPSGQFKPHAASPRRRPGPLWLILRLARPPASTILPRYDADSCAVQCVLSLSFPARWRSKGGALFIGLFEDFRSGQIAVCRV
jgi:hypothetical protein